MTGKHWLGAFAGFLVLTVAACGGGGGGGGSTPDGTTSTISGNISNQSTALRMRGAPPTMLARLLETLSPVSDAVAGQHGISVHVNGLETETDSNGFFSITGLFSGHLTITFGNGSQTFTLEVDVPPGATVMLKDILLHDDGTATPGGTGFFALLGTLDGTSCDTTPPTLTIALGNQTVVVDLDDATKIKISGQGDAATCADLASQSGMPVSAAGEQLEDGSLLARRVKVGVHGGEGHHERHVEFHGLVTASSCPDSITVQRTDTESVTVHLTDSTRFEDGVTCADLADKEIEVEGKLTADGVEATEIEIENSGDGESA